MDESLDGFLFFTSCTIHSQIYLCALWFGSDSVNLERSSLRNATPVISTQNFLCRKGSFSKTCEPITVFTVPGIRF